MFGYLLRPRLLSPPGMEGVEDVFMEILLHRTLSLGQAWLSFTWSLSVFRLPDTTSSEVKVPNVAKA